jgi:hypothetical protein
MKGRLVRRNGRNWHDDWTLPDGTRLDGCVTLAGAAAVSSTRRRRLLRHTARLIARRSWRPRRARRVNGNQQSF